MNRNYNKRRKCIECDTSYLNSLPDLNEDIDPNQFFDNDGSPLDPKNADDVRIINEKILHVDETKLDRNQRKKLENFRQNIIRKCAVCEIAFGYTHKLLTCTLCDTHVCWGCYIGMSDHAPGCCVNCFEYDYLRGYRCQQDRSLLAKQNCLFNLPYLSTDLWNIVFQYTYSLIV